MQYDISYDTSLLFFLILLNHLQDYMFYTYMVLMVTGLEGIASRNPHSQVQHFYHKKVHSTMVKNTMVCEKYYSPVSEESTLSPKIHLSLICMYLK